MPPADTSLERVSTYLQRVGLTDTGASVDALPGDASDRRYMRLRLADGSSRILLVHQHPFDAATLPWLNVARLFDRISIPTPAVQDVADDLGILVLDDLGDITAYTFLRTATPAEQRTLYMNAVDLIVQIQQGGERLKSPEYLPFTVAFDREKLVSELEFFGEHYLRAHRQVRLDPTSRSSLHEEFQALARSLADEHQVLCHRDYHSRNLMLRDGELHVIDFQDARLGPDTYDLVSLLRDCYVRLPLLLVDEMVSYYHEQTGSPPDATGPRYLERFDRMSVQRHLKALGTFGYQAAVVGNSSYLDDVPRTLGYLGDVFRRRIEFDRLRALLSPHIPELA